MRLKVSGARIEWPLGMVLGLEFRVQAFQKCEAVPRRAHISGSWNFVSLNSRLESNKRKKKFRLSAFCFRISFQS